MNSTWKIFILYIYIYIYIYIFFFFFFLPEILLGNGGETLSNFNSTALLEETLHWSFFYFCFNTDLFNKPKSVAQGRLIGSFSLATLLFFLCCFFSFFFLLPNSFLHWINLFYRDVRMCMHYISYWGGRNHIAFVGDSRIRQLYFEFMNLVSTNEVKEGKEHKDIHYTDDQISASVVSNFLPPFERVWVFFFFFFFF